MDHEMCLTWYFVGAKGLGDANLHRNREIIAHFIKVAKMSNFDHKSPSYRVLRYGVKCNVFQLYQNTIYFMCVLWL